MTDIEERFTKNAEQFDSLMIEMLERTKRFEIALEKLAKLENGDTYGNSIGNEIAQEALGRIS